MVALRIAGLYCSTFRSVCFDCLQPCCLGAVCPCNVEENGVHPYFRYFGESTKEDTNKPLALVRQFDLSKKDVVDFYKGLSALPHDACLCPCGQKLHRASDCHEMTCSCGFHVCYFCNFAQYIDNDNICMLKHYEYCSQYPKNTDLYIDEYRIVLPMPCGESCQSFGKDCTKSSHRHWKELYNANRRARWAIAFQNNLSDPELRKIAHAELSKYPEFTSYQYCALME